MEHIHSHSYRYGPWLLSDKKRQLNSFDNDYIIYKPKVFNIYPLQKNTAITCCRVTENHEEVQLISQFVVGIVV